MLVIEMMIFFNYSETLQYQKYLKTNPKYSLFRTQLIYTLIQPSPLMILRATRNKGIARFHSTWGHSLYVHVFMNLCSKKYPSQLALEHPEKAENSRKMETWDWMIHTVSKAQNIHITVECYCHHAKDTISHSGFSPSYCSCLLQDRHLGSLGSSPLQNAISTTSLWALWLNSEKDLQGNLYKALGLPMLQVVREFL